MVEPFEVITGVSLLLPFPHRFGGLKVVEG
nr:MAG TPA: hypothetical protein [Caudoviricetes sp.]